MDLSKRIRPASEARGHLSFSNIQSTLDIMNQDISDMAISGETALDWDVTYLKPSIKLFDIVEALHEQGYKAKVEVHECYGRIMKNLHISWKE